MFRDQIEILRQESAKSDIDWSVVWKACCQATEDFERMLQDREAYPIRNPNIETIVASLKTACRSKISSRKNYGSISMGLADQQQLDGFLTVFFDQNKVLNFFEDPITMMPFINPVLISEDPNPELSKKVFQTVSLKSFNDHFGPRRIGASGRSPMTFPEKDQAPVQDGLMLGLLAWREAVEPLLPYCSTVDEGLQRSIVVDRQGRKGSDIDLLDSFGSATASTPFLHHAPVQTKSKASQWCCVVM